MSCPILYAVTSYLSSHNGCVYGLEYRHTQSTRIAWIGGSYKFSSQIPRPTLELRSCSLSAGWQLAAVCAVSLHLVL